MTINQRTSQLPSIQAFVSTIDLANCYPSIEIKESSRNFFNFYVESEIWHNSRLPQGWGPSLQISQTAIIWTFQDSTLQVFILTRRLTPAQFPFTYYRQFVQGFVDDFNIFSPKNAQNAQELHCLAIDAVFYALHDAGWLVKLEPYLCFPWVMLGLE